MWSRKRAALVFSIPLLMVVIGMFLLTLRAEAPVLALLGGMSSLIGVMVMAILLLMMSFRLALERAEASG